MNTSVRGILLAAAIPLLISGAPSALAQSYKIAFVHAEKAVENSPQYAAYQKELQQTFEPRVREIEGKVKQYKKMQEDLERDQAIMSDSQLRKAQRELISLERRIKNSKEELEQDSAIRSNELRVKLVKVVNEVIQELAKAEDLDMVVNENVVVYVNDRIDITDKVSDRLKRKFKSGR